MELIGTGTIENEEASGSWKKAYPEKPRSKLIEEILNDEQIKNIIKRVARRNDTPVFLVQRKARKILKEMVADLGAGAIKISYRLFKFLWNRTYSKLYIDFESLAKVKPIIEQHPVILIPAHKSHIDYLLLSSIFHENGLVPPFIAAGVNLAFWPMGYLFRKAGAFFIRRTIGNDILYYKLLFKYMSTLIKEKGTQEFFIEGGRSRNGKLQSPKLGLLTLHVDTFLEEEVENLYFIPISLAYDRILEENAYCEELSGGIKAKESIWEVLKSAKVLKSNYGNAFIKFGTPISLRDYLESFRGEKLTPKLKKQKIKELGQKIIREINAITPVTPSSLASLTLLSSPKRRISHEDFSRFSGSYISFFRHMNVRIAETLEAGERSLLEGITFFTQAKFIEPYIKNRARMYKFKRRHRVILDYYKNNIINFCAPLLFTAASIAKEPSKKISLENLKSDIAFLSNTFMYEFILPEDVKKGFDNTVDWLKDEGIISESEENGEKFLKIVDTDLIRFFARGLRNYLEAYYVASVGIEKVAFGELKIRDGVLHSALLEVGLKMLKKEKIFTREAVTTPYLSNATKYINRNIIHSLKTLLPVRDLEEEEEIESHDHDPVMETREREKLGALIAGLEKFLV